MTYRSRKGGVPSRCPVRHCGHDGAYPKRIAIEIGTIKLHVPRVRNARLESVTPPEVQRCMEGPRGRVISFLREGISTSDIQAHLDEIYGTYISRGTIRDHRCHR